jgi:hypothetical protein
MNDSMPKKSFFIVVFFLLHVILSAQINPKTVPSPAINDFAPSLQFLASPELEGRETGTQGAAIAAEYIASRMENLGLKPYNRMCASTPQLSDYFQPFKLIRYNTENSSIEVYISKKQEPKLKLNIYSDFRVRNIVQSLSLESVPVFAGYGIVDSDLGYNDYSGLDVKGKIVLIMEGYPGQQDSTSIARRKFKPIAEKDDFDIDKKCLEAANQGASAVITINKAFLAGKPGNQIQKNVAPVKNPGYSGAEFVLPTNAGKPLIGCFRLNINSSEKFAGMLGIDFRKAEQQIAERMKFEQVSLKNIIDINTSTVVDTIAVNNVVGLLTGKDTSQSVILGAHYDHLGKRGETVFYGSDDNASGVAGLLAMAKVWSENLTVPPCNIIFASWAAEEKGLIGSEYFTSKLARPEKVKLYINMDMISRSVSEDKAARMLSIGTRTSDEYLRELARGKNSTLDSPFKLDLWDVTGHSGSDYANFMSKNIPVMTYNTGLHDDYHTPHDIRESADLKKMGDVLKLLNGCLNYVLEGVNTKLAH